VLEKEKFELMLPRQADSVAEPDDHRVGRVVDMAWLRRPAKRFGGELLKSPSAISGS
jgi:hypothetical protein